MEKVKSNHSKKTEKTEKIEKPQTVKVKANDDYLAVIRIRGGVRQSKVVKDTLYMLKLRNQHNMIIIPKNSSLLGMVRKVKDYVTYGEISPELKQKLGDKVHRLHPPRGGYERKGIKLPFSIGGVLGYRKEKINDLIKKML